MVFSSVASLVLRAMYIAENRKRDNTAQPEVKKNGYDDEKSEEVERLSDREVEGAAWSDLTDKQNPYFRYVY
jgi:hypothetical protein